jgi:threonylcarbamoyladenosine tRNA methylthiotransferase MtaB
MGIKRSGRRVKECEAPGETRDIEPNGEYFSNMNAIAQKHHQPARRKRAALYTLGCRLNQSETHLLTEQLEAAGYDVVPFGDDADLGIINTCTVTREADAKSRQMVRQFVRRNPQAYTAVIGCYSQMGYKALQEIDGVDLIVGNQEKLNVLHYAAQGKSAEPLVVRDRIERDDFTIEFEGSAPVNWRANLKIQDGCDFMCSFCIIPFARGRGRSRDMSNLLMEARGLVARGAKELVLTGVNIGTYNWNGRSVVDVIDALNEVDGLLRIRISSIEPTTIPEALFERMNDPDHVLVPYLHIPLQSGSDAVLQRMKRRYTRAEYLDFLRLAADRVPGLGLGTDIMVGMPGESDAEFEDTVSLLAESDLFYAHVFKYSEREGTAALRLPGKIDPRVKNARGAKIRRLSAEKRRAFHARHAGSTMEVLFEHAEDGYWSGYTGNYVRVAARSDEDLKNVARFVTLNEPCGDFVLGRLA